MVDVEINSGISELQIISENAGSEQPKEVLAEGDNVGVNVPEPPKVKPLVLGAEALDLMFGEPTLADREIGDNTLKEVCVLMARAIHDKRGEEAISSGVSTLVKVLLAHRPKETLVLTIEAVELLREQLNSNPGLVQVLREDQEANEDLIFLKFPTENFHPPVPPVAQ